MHSDRHDALAILKRLRDAGHESYFAGGCVRDMLLGHAAKDWDVATAATPDVVRKLFSNTQAVGAAFGVILVRHGKSTIQVATFRTDGEYLDGRRPSEVKFTSAEQDARRRDFTINGLFFDPLENRVIDFVDGRADLDARRLRAIGEPEHRFNEDHLRLLRAIRFASRFDLEIEPKTEAAILAGADRLKGISPERVGEEVRLMLTAPTRTIAWKWLWKLNLAPVIFRFAPENHSEPKNKIFESLAPSQEISFGLALAAASLSLHSDKQFPTHKTILQYQHAMRQAMRISNAESDELTDSLTGIDLLFTHSTIAAKKRFLARLTAVHSELLMRAMADINIEKSRIESLLTDLKALSATEFAPVPLLTGDQLVTAGFSPGPLFKKILESVYDAQLEDRIKSHDEAMQMAREMSQAKK